nr:hypothetical protein [Gemmatimonadota bacterium]
DMAAFGVHGRTDFGAADPALRPLLVPLVTRPLTRRAAETVALAHLRALGYEVGERTRLDAALRLPATATNDIEVTGNAHGNQA